MRTVLVCCALLMSVVSLFGQVVEVSLPVFRAEKFVNSAADSLRDIDIQVTSSNTTVPISTYPFLAYQKPDSVRFDWTATAPSDSIKGDLYLLSKDVVGNYQETLIDSILASEKDFKTVNVQGALKYIPETIGVRFNARSSGNAHTSTGNALTMRMRLFYKIGR